MTTTDKVDAWMPLWIGAYLADTMTLTTQQHGAYLLLLFAYWRNRGPLPDDDEDLASIVKASPDEWVKLRAKLARFFTVADGQWVHGRCDTELAAALAHRAAAASKARAGAEARWKKSLKNAVGNAPSMPEALPEAEPEALPVDVPKQCPTPSPTPTTSLPTVEKETRKRAAPLPCPDGVAAQTWDDFLSLRKAKKAPVTATVLEGAQAEAGKAGMTLEAFLRVWCTRGTQGLQADWLKPHERGQQADPPEPAWRREQRERNEAFLGPAAARRSTPTTIDMEPADAASDLLG